MASVNKVILVGNLGRDPESRQVGEKLVCNFSLATTSGRGDNTVTEWHRIVVWDKQAEICMQYLSKGRSVYIDGRIQTRSWDDKQSGEKKSMQEIVATHVVFLGGGDNQNQGQSHDSGQRQSGGGQGGGQQRQQRQQGGGRGYGEQRQGGNQGGGQQRQSGGYGGGGYGGGNQGPSQNWDDHDGGDNFNDDPDADIPF